MHHSTISTSQHPTNHRIFLLRDNVVTAFEWVVFVVGLLARVVILGVAVVQSLYPSYSNRLHSLAFNVISTLRLSAMGGIVLLVHIRVSYS